jgi:hypothetical protein
MTVYGVTSLAAAFCVTPALFGGELVRGVNHGELPAQEWTETLGGDPPALQGLLRQRRRAGYAGQRGATRFGDSSPATAHLRQPEIARGSAEMLWRQNMSIVMPSPFLRECT